VSVLLTRKREDWRLVRVQRVLIAMFPYEPLYECIAKHPDSGSVTNSGETASRKPHQNVDR
jgi:hypothetical protein